MEEELKVAAKYLAERSRTRTGGFNTRLQAPIAPTAQNTPKSSSNWLGNVARTAANVVIGARDLPSKVTRDIATDVVDAVSSTGTSLQEVITGERRKQLERNVKASEATSRISQANLSYYKQGKITKAEYLENSGNLGRQFKDIGESNRAIEADSDVTKRIVDVIETGLLPLSVGKATLGKVTLFRNGRALPGISKVTVMMENAINRIPSVRPILANRGSNLMLLEGRSALSISAMKQATLELSAKKVTKDLAAAYYLKYPLVVGQSTGDVYEVLKTLQGEREAGVGIQRAVFLGLSVFEGGPIGVALEQIGKFGGTAKSIVFGTGSYVDELGKRLNLDGNAVEYFAKLKGSDPQAYSRRLAAMEAMQETQLRMSGGNPGLAADLVVAFYKESRGFGLTDFPIKTWDDLFKDMESYYDDWELLTDSLKAGLIKANNKTVGAVDLKKYALATFDTGAKDHLISQLRKAEKAGGIPAMNDLMDMLEGQGTYFTQHDTLWPYLRRVIGESDWDKKISSLTTTRFLKELKLPKKLEDQLAESGRIVVRMQKTAAQDFVERGTGRKLVSKFATNLDDFNPTVEPYPLLRSIGGALRKAGLSPEDTSKYTYEALKRNLSDNLVSVAKDSPQLAALVAKDADGALDDATVVITKLQQFASDPDKLKFGGIVGKAARTAAQRSEVQDIRLLSTKEIAEALDIDFSSARLVKSAVYQAHTQVPLQIRGLGDWLVDRNFRYNPLSRPYARTQSALRYAWNPFFRTQEIVETEFLGQIETGGKTFQFPGVNAVRHMFGNGEKEVAEYVRRLEDAQILSGTFFGEAADDAVFGRLTAVLSKSQKESLVGVALDMGKKMYPELSKSDALDMMISDHYDKLADGLRVLVQYPSQSVLNSAMARTLNLAFFPMRYNLKVTTLAAQSLSRQPIHVQLGVIHGVYNLSDWLKSDEGKNWYSENYEAIRVMQWLTPIGSITHVLNLIDGGYPDSVGEIGQLGGLPFGIITQVLDSQFEDFNINTPYVDPRSGEVIPSWVPVSSAARVRTAMNDLLMSVFTYPGRTLGLPGKGELVRSATGKIIPYDPDSYNIVTRGDLTDEQKAYIKSIREGYGTMPTYNGSYKGPILPPGPMDPPIELQDPNLVAPAAPTEPDQTAAASPRPKSTARPIGPR